MQSTDRDDPAELFLSTAPYYARYRPGYPRGFVDHLVARFALDGTGQVLDLGCGTGQIALPLAPHVARVHAVDPEPGMLAEGRRLAGIRGIGNIDWIVGDSRRVDELHLPPLMLATMGASFHWMDRDQVLRDLDRLVSPGGAVVVASGGASVAPSAAPWDDLVSAIRTRYLGPLRRTGAGIGTRPEERHAAVLARSAFSRVDTVEWDWTLDRDLDSLVGSQFSFSYSAPTRFGSDEHRAAFEAELRAALTERFPDGVFRERIRTEALIATRR